MNLKKYFVPMEKNTAKYTGPFKIVFLLQLIKYYEIFEYTKKRNKLIREFVHSLIVVGATV